MNAGHKVPDLTPPFRCRGLIAYFNDIRSRVGVIDNPMTMAAIRDWQEHTGIVLDRWERDCMFAMDRALRHSYGEVVKYHHDWDAKIAEAKAKHRRGGR